MSVILNLSAIISIAQGGGSAPLTMDEAVRIALANGFAIRTAESNLERTRQRVNEARAGLGPRVVLGGSYTRFDQPIGGNGGGGVAADQSQATVSLTMPVDISGSISKGVQAASAAVSASAENVETARNDIKQVVRRSYLRVLEADALVEVSRQAVENAQQQLDKTRIEVEAGSKARFDLLRFETQLAQARSNLIAAENGLTLARQAFNNALARPVETPVALSDITALPELSVNEQALVSTAQASRPELRGLAYTAEAQRFLTVAERRGLLPSLGLSVNGAQSLGTSLGRSQSASGSVALNFPVFDNGVTRARVAQARQDENNTQIAIEQARLGVSLEVRQALSNLINARSRLAVAQVQQAAAEEAFRIAQVRYDAGEGIPLEITDAQTELTRARVAVVTARYDYLSAFADLQRAIGRDDIQAMTGNVHGSKS